MANLTAKLVLVYLTNKYKHNWQKIYNHISKKKPAPPAAEMLEYLDKRKIDYTKWVTLIEPEFPELLKRIHQPPFALDTTTEFFRYILDIHRLVESTKVVDEDGKFDAAL